MNRDEMAGKADQLKGKLKQAAGDSTDDADLHDEGVADEAAGTAGGIWPRPAQGRRGDRGVWRENQALDS